MGRHAHQEWTGETVSEILFPRRLYAKLDRAVLEMMERGMDLNHYTLRGPEIDTSVSPPAIRYSIVRREGESSTASPPPLDQAAKSYVKYIYLCDATHQDRDRWLTTEVVG
jgi:hypothetical protein